VEFAWLLLHALDVLGTERGAYAEVIRSIFDHAVAYGIDSVYGGVFAEGPYDRPPASTEKQFWQNAEMLVGMLDACLLFDDDRYWEAFKAVYDFVFEKFVAVEAGGEWYERLDRVGKPIDDAIGHAWKISYHTVRAVIQSIERLNCLLSRCEAVAS
jgi:mannobiose 2-epimerase